MVFHAVSRQMPSVKYGSRESSSATATCPPEQLSPEMSAHDGPKWEQEVLKMIKETILIVDDNKEVVSALSDVL
jgi:hypothetical protein